MLASERCHVLLRTAFIRMEHCRWLHWYLIPEKLFPAYWQERTKLCKGAKFGRKLKRTSATASQQHRWSVNRSPDVIGRSKIPFSLNQQNIWLSRNTKLMVWTIVQFLNCSLFAAKKLRTVESYNYCSGVVACTWGTRKRSNSWPRFNSRPTWSR